MMLAGGPLADSQPNGLLATQSVAISPVSPVYSHHHHQPQHHHHHQQQQQLCGTSTPRQVDFIRSSPTMMSVVDPTVDSPDDDGVRLTSYAQPIPLDGFCSPASTMSASVCTPLVGVGVADDRPSPVSTLQLIDYVPARAADCPPYGHLALRGDIYRASGDPFAADMYRTFSIPPLKSELI